MVTRVCSTHLSLQFPPQGFPRGSVGKESAWNAGDPRFDSWVGKIHWRRAGEGIGYPLQYSWASLVAQLVKNPPAMWETWVRPLGWEDPLEKFHGLYSPWGCRVRHD